MIVPGDVSRAKKPERPCEPLDRNAFLSGVSHSSSCRSALPGLREIRGSRPLEKEIRHTQNTHCYAKYALLRIPGALAAESVKSREAMGESAVLFEKRIQERFEALQAATRLTLDSLKGDIQAQLGTMSTALKDQLEANGTQIKNQFSVLQDAVSQQLAGLVQGSQHNAEQLRTALNERLGAIQADNATKLEEMRRTVDEKLHATLEHGLSPRPA